jgi:hypothetical protein
MINVLNEDSLQLLDLPTVIKIRLRRMTIKKIVLGIFLLCLVGLFAPKTVQAFDLRNTFISENSVITKIQEGVEYFFAFKVENKVSVLEKQAEKRLSLAQDYAEDGNNERVKDLMRDYLQIKEKQDNLLGKTSDGKVLGGVEDRTIEQQKTMEEIKTKIDEDGKQNVINVQEQVVNQVAERVVVTNGTVGQTEFLNRVEHIWAPGTGPGGTAGVVYEGGSKLMFAPGTSAGGTSGADIKTVEIKTGGVVEDDLPPGVTRGDAGTAVDRLAPGTTNSLEGGGSDTWTIDP